MNKWDKRFIELATFISGWSKDPSTKVGAVISDKRNRIVSAGFNGFARGLSDSRIRYNEKELKYDLVIHAEENAIMFSHSNLDECSIYISTLWPCIRCANRIIQSGIKRVVYQYPKDKDLAKRYKYDFEISGILYKESNVEFLEYKQ